MTVDLTRARDFIYSHGSLWERAIYAYRFEGAGLDRVRQCLLCYKNADGGWGHGLEYDIKTPDSHPLAAEFALTILRDLELPLGDLFVDTPEWLEVHRAADGAFTNPGSVLDYPHAFWWDNGGQTIPASITGNLAHLDLAPPALLATTRAWVQANLTLEAIRREEWIFMLYHAHDYFLHVEDFPEIATFREATIRRIVELADSAPEARVYHIAHYAPSPTTPIARFLPPSTLERTLAVLATRQCEDGGWDDEHGLPHWRPYVTLLVLNMLRNFGQIAG